MTTKSPLSDRIITALLSIVTACLIGCLTFLWNVNSTLATLQERDTENIKAREDVLIKINNMQLDIRDIRERLIRVESKTK